MLGEDLVDVVTEAVVVDETTGILATVFLNQLLVLLFGHGNAKSSNAGSESCLTASTLAELIEIKEELLDTDSVLGNSGLQTLLNIELNLELTSRSSEHRLMLSVLVCDGLNEVLERNSLNCCHFIL